MNLTDKEILELTELCNALVDGTLTEAQKAQLSEKLAFSEAARQFYVRFTGLSASLHTYASELQTEPADVPVRTRWRPGWWWAVGALAAAAVIVLGFWLGAGRPRGNVAPVAETETDEFVAQITGVKDCPLKPGDQLRRGQRLEIASGVVEITFDCGAQITLEGPAALDVNSAWDATLERGTLKANVPSEAVGFRISHRAVEVVDLGTEFSLVAPADGPVELYVLKGEVKATPRDQASLVMHEHQARRFGETGSVEILSTATQLAHLAQPVKLERVPGLVQYAHWSFDDGADRELGGVRTTGRWGQALQFDGQFDTHAVLPGIGRNTSRTVAFWVKVPADASLPDAGAMVAWLAKGSKKAEAHPVQIGWNTEPGAGPLGALCTEFGRGLIVGSTSLRDGRWHHVAVVFALAGRNHDKLHVKQYVDGRLETTPVKLARKHHRDKSGEAAGDVVWLGRRLGRGSAGRERFHGELDELFIADRALASPAIRQLLKTNSPEPSDVANTR